MQPGSPEPPEPSLGEDLADLAISRIRVAAAIVIDVLLVLVALPALWFLDQVRQWLPLHGFSAFFVTATEWLLGFATLAGIVLYIWHDLRVLYRRLSRD